MQVHPFGFDLYHLSFFVLAPFTEPLVCLSCAPPFPARGSFFASAIFRGPLHAKLQNDADIDDDLPATPDHHIMTATATNPAPFIIHDVA